MSGCEVDGGEEEGVDVAGGMVGGSGVDICWCRRWFGGVDGA